MNRVVIAETLRRHVTHPAYLVYAAGVAIIALGISKFDQAGSVWPSLVALLAIIAGCAPIGPERSSGTLQLILVKPVKRWEYLTSRVTGVAIAVWAVAVVAALCELMGRAAWADALSFERIAFALVNALADALLTISLLTLLGSLTRAYFNIAIYFALQIAFATAMGVLGFLRTSGSAVGRFLNEHIAIERALVVVQRNLFPDLPQGFNRDWLLMVLSNATIALVLACLAFRRREVPYGAE